MGITKAKNLAAYLNNCYRDKFNRNMSPVRLQKTLYFCFAYWGGFVRKGKNNPQISDIDVSSYDECLFDEKIEAWVYGPVVPDVYHENNIQNFYIETIFDSHNATKDIVDNVFEDTLAINDFKLVDIAHEDNVWKKHFKYENDYHNEEIPKEEIIEEYATKN